MGIMTILEARGFTLRQWFCEFSEVERQIEIQAYRQKQDHLEARQIEDEKKRKQKK